jgi:hypothetical protein
VSRKDAGRFQGTADYIGEGIRELRAERDRLKAQLDASQTSLRLAAETCADQSQAINKLNEKLDAAADALQDIHHRTMDCAGTSDAGLRQDVEFCHEKARAALSLLEPRQ